MLVDRYAPAPIVLAHGAARREPSRPAKFRDATFTDKFDDDTLFYDCFFDALGKEVLLVGPPLFNLAGLLQCSTFVAQPGGACVATRMRQMDRHAQVRFAVPRGTDRVALDGPLGRIEIPPRPPRHGLFAGKRVLMTLSKNNELKWIQDWIRYHRDIHAADAVLLYDNASTRYSSDELAAAIAEVGGLDAACVVDWPFKYGPQSQDPRFWDSDFCQRGVLEHARWFFLQRARSVLNGDIDELVAGGDGRSVFSAAERSLLGMACYFGVWVDGLEGAPETPTGPAHSYAPFAYYTDPARSPYGFSNTKWVVVPGRCLARFQWAPHTIVGARGLYTRLSQTKAYLYRHYREISDGWKYQRDKRRPYQADLFVRDTQMSRNFERVDWTR